MNTQSQLPSRSYLLFVVLSLIGFSLQVFAVNRLFQRFPLESWEDPILTWSLLGMSALCWGRLVSLGYRYFRLERQAGTELVNLGGQEFLSLIEVSILFVCAMVLALNLLFGKISKTLLEADMASRIIGFTAVWIFLCCSIYERFSHKWITNRGILASGLLLKWEVIESFQWIGQDQNTLCLVLRKEKTPGLLWGQVKVKHQIPAEHKESVDRILNQYLTPKGEQYVSHSTLDHRGRIGLNGFSTCQVNEIRHPNDHQSPKKEFLQPMKPEPTNMPTDKPDIPQRVTKENRPKSIWVKMRNVVIAIVLFCLVWVVCGLILDGCNRVFYSATNFALEKMGLKDNPWLPRIALVILIFVILGIMWVAFNYLRKEAKRDRAGQGLPCPNCGQPIHFKTFRVVNSCSHCGHHI